MTYHELFSKRYGLRPSSEGLISETVPESARIGLSYLVEDFSQYIDPVTLYINLCKAMRITRLERDRTLGNCNNNEILDPIEHMITSYEWWRFYDICEVVYRELDVSRYSYKTPVFEEALNKLFIDEELGFESKKGKIEKRGSGFVDANVKEARVLLKGGEFQGADQHFEKAIRALNIRPLPDVENCIKDAVSAIESVGRVIVGDDKALLDDIIKNAVTIGAIPKPLDHTFLKVYAYRGNEPGVAHGSVDLSKVTEAEAELILAMSAAMIIYLVKKRGLLHK